MLKLIAYTAGCTRRVLISAVAAACTLAVGAPHAQVLEEVLVTAQKREESVQDVGISITAFSGDQIEKLGFSDSVQVATQSPGVYISGSSAGQNAQFVVRGITQNDFLDAIEGPTAIYLDEGYVAQQNSGTFALFDIDRVEVLKGPQGTLFGRNATGGLVHFITRKPTDEPEAYGEITYGRYNNVNLQAAVSGPLSEAASARASIYYNTHDDILKNIYPSGGGTAGTPAGGPISDHWNDQTIAGRVQLQFNPNEDVEMYVMGHYANTEQGDGPYQQSATAAVFDGAGVQINTVRCPVGNTIAACGGRQGTDLFGYRDPDGDDFITSKDFSPDDNAEFETYGFNGKLTWNLGWANLTAVSDYKKYNRNLTVDVDAGPVNQLVFNPQTDNWSFSQELRLNGESEQYRWVAGVYYMHIGADVVNGFMVPVGSLLNFLGPVAFGVPPGGIAWSAPNEVELDTDSYSLFGQVEYDFTDQWTFIAGLRVIEEEKDFSLQSSVYLLDDPLKHTLNTRTFSFPTSLDDPSGAAYEDSNNEFLWTGKVQINYKPNEDWLVYFGVNRGVKAGAYNAPLPLTGPPLRKIDIGYDEEVLLSYEGGVKVTLFGGTTRANFSAYYYDYTDYHAFSFIGVSGIVTNQKASSTGIEFDIQSNPFEGFDISWGISAFDFEVEDVAVAPGNVKDVVPSFAPRMQMAGLARYGWPMLGGEMALQADANWHSNFYHNLNNFAANKYPAAVIGNVRLVWTSGDEAWQLTGFVNNVADARNPTIGFDLAGICGCNEESFGKPRWYGLTARYNWK